MVILQEFLEKSQQAISKAWKITKHAKQSSNTTAFTDEQFLKLGP